MQQKRKHRGGTQNIQINIYPKTGRSAKKARDVVNQAGKVAPK